MRSVLLVLVLFAFAFYLFFNQAIGIIFFIAVLALSLVLMLCRGAEKAGSAGKHALKKIHSDLKEAEPQHPPLELWQKAVKETGKKAGERINTEDGFWTSRGMPKRLGESSQNLMDKFFELFK